MGKLHKIRKAIEKDPNNFRSAWGIRYEYYKDTHTVYIAPSYWKPSYKAFLKCVLQDIENKGGRQCRC